LVTGNIKEEALGHDTYIYSNLPTNQVSTQKLQCTLWLHLYRQQWKALLSAKWHFITPYLWSVFVYEIIDWLDVNGCYTLGCVLSSSAENSQILSHSFFRRLSIEQQWCGKTLISIYPQKVQQLDQYLMKPCHLDEIC